MANQPNTIKAAITQIILIKYYSNFLMNWITIVITFALVNIQIVIVAIVKVFIKELITIIA